MQILVTFIATCSGFYCFCPLCLPIKLNIDISKMVYLGVWFDSNFQFYSHINKTCHSVFYSLYNIRGIRKYLPLEVAITLIQARVKSRIDYCNAILYGLPATHIRKLQRVQNAAARLLTNTARYSHITPFMIDHHWLPHSSKTNI